MPKRIQRRRTRGWRMPENAVYVGRPTKWGNPFHVGGKAHVFMLGGWVQEDVPDAATAVHFFRDWITQEIKVRRGGDEHRADLLASLANGALAGKDLACWCPLDQPCHADVLLKIANGGDQ